jgi:hypothetical protein
MPPSFLILHYLEVSAQLHVLAALAQGKSPTIPIGQEAEWAPVSAWML